MAIVALVTCLSSTDKHSLPKLKTQIIAFHTLSSLLRYVSTGTQVETKPARQTETKTKTQSLTNAQTETKTRTNIANTTETETQTKTATHTRAALSCA